MFKQACLIGFLLIVLFFIPISSNKSVNKRGHEVFHLLKQTKERVKHGVQCVPPSKYFAGSCYTYMKMSPAPSWEGAFNNCQSLPTATDASLSAIETIEEYEFIERELIGLKSGSESVSVYIGLRKMNNTWLWSNQIPLKETPVYRFWVDNNRDILAYDCGILWLARNTSVITPAPCVEQALRPYVCKHTIDRCYNNSGHCGRYGTCLNQPMNNSYKCQCRFLYTGDRCEKWSSQGIQIIVGLVIIVVILIASTLINNFPRKIQPSNDVIDHVVDNTTFLHTSSPMKCSRWSSSLTSVQSSMKTIKSRRSIFILLTIILTMFLSLMFFFTQNSIERNQKHFQRLLEFCSLYENDFYLNFLTLPLALVVLLIIILNQTRLKYREEKCFLHLPTPFNPFSKINRFDSTILCGLISYEILRIIEEIFLRTNLTIHWISLNGPLFDLIRQIGLIMIVALRYYPVYVTIEMKTKNLLYSGLSAFYMCFDLALRIFEHLICSNHNVSMFKSSHNDSQTIFDEFRLDLSTIDLIQHAPYYFCLIYICLRLIWFFIISFYRSFVCCDEEKNSHRTSLKHIYHEPTTFQSIEHHYVRRLFDSNRSKNDERMNYFRYSKQILHLYFIGFLLVYSLTFNVLRSGLTLIEHVTNFILLPLLLIYDQFNLPDANPMNLKYEILFACLCTTFICFLQLIFGLRNYRRHVLDAYQGITTDLPSRLSLNQSRQMFKHIHYAGYFIAYLALSYILLVNVLFFVLIIFRMIFAHLFLIEDLAKFFVPIFVIYLSTNFIHWFLCRTFLFEKNGKFLTLKNLRFYFILNYFNFFFDCCIGMISCAFRMFKASLMGLIFFSRLDYSVFGRNLEKNDLTFVSYASFIYVECLHTHPVLIYFTSIVQEQIDERNRYRTIGKRDMNFYTDRQRIQFRWFLAITLSRNRQLIVLRKFYSSRSKSKSISHRQIFDRCVTYRNHTTTTCTTLLLDTDEHDEERKRTF